MGYNPIEAVADGMKHQVTLDYTNPKQTGAIKSFDDLEHAQYYMKGMRLSAQAHTPKLPWGGKYVFRLRARGPRQTPEVIRHYIELDWKHFVKTGQYEGDLESYMAMVALKSGCRYAKRRANQDLPTKFGKKWVLYRNIA